MEKVKFGSGIFNWSRLGPGLLFAAAAIGVSHLVQSTRAGASYAWLLIPAIVLANLLKWPLFEAGPRYAYSQKRSLLHAYSRVAVWALPVVALVTFGSMFIVTATVGVVTAGLFQQVLPFKISESTVLLILLLGCVLILWNGKQQRLEKIIRPILLALVFATLLAVVLGLFKPFPNWSTASFSFGNTGDLAFFIALMGWMPAPLDISIWYSQWSALKLREGGDYIATDFRVGFGGTTLMAVIFVLLGAIFLFDAGELPVSAIGFAGSLQQAYSEIFGVFSWLIVVAAITCMFSTTLAVMDAYPRVCRAILRTDEDQSTGLYRLFLVILAVGGWIIAIQFSGKMTLLVQFATIMAFLSAPVLAWLNMSALRLLPDAHQPNRGYFVLGYFSTFLLVVFSVYYLFRLL